MEELLEVVTFHLPRYENTVKTAKLFQVKLICHKICHSVFVHQGEGISAYDLSVFDSEHGQRS